MKFACVRIKARFSAFLCLMAMPALLRLPLQCRAASQSGCQVHATNYLVWKAEEMSNPWVRLEIVPQIGGRLIQVTFGGHDLLYINPLLQGQVIPLGTKPFEDRNYGGDKIWPMPEGNQDEQHWSGGGNLDDAPFTLQVLSSGPKCAVRLSGPIDPEIGQRYIRDISIEGDTPVISFHVVMQNMSGYPRTWSEQTITEYPTSNPAGSDNFNPKFWGVTEVNRASSYLNGYHVRTGPADNPAFTVQDGTFRVHWNNIMQEVWIDSQSGWLAAVDGSTGYTMVERHRIDPTAVYPGKASIIFYSTGEPTPPPAPGQNTEPREGPFMEAEMNSPMVELAPGESYAMDTQWYPTRMGEDFKTTTYSGVIGTPLTAIATPAGLVLSGSFGVFYAGDLVVHLYGREARTTVKLMSVVPTEPVRLHITLQAPPNTTRVSVHLVDSNGLDRGPLGEVRVQPAPSNDGTNAR
ncbi:MAG: hypothetical protein WAM20_19395 [Acidobacteriaceae bacterium]